jgi:hypothetical protein
MQFYDKYLFLEMSCCEKAKKCKAKKWTECNNIARKCDKHYQEWERWYHSEYDCGGELEDWRSCSTRECKKHVLQKLCKRDLKDL